MPHKCTRCGREFEDGSTGILKGCPSCGGKKFLYIRESTRHEDVLEEKTIEEIAEETGEEELEVREEEEAPKRVECYDRVESIRIVGPGSYELNIEKLAQSEEMVVSLGREGKYMVDILSMHKKDNKKSSKK
ncbi:Zn-ribbon domain-containing protein [Methanofollis tationis]|uniref:Zn-ribbon domain-containing protein n=1 Tax=Methanofollis tationis TaxID=81417 RepID=A0A7K4HNK9_9EURY|nr:Zn-ribbon domain-containing protein [Methanofollis tationis]NVO66480.1 Zn-ribbon domain-containing protein [Methanofollis tationis]